MNALWVALGGACGALMRYGVGIAVAPESRFPWATLLVNAAGSGCLGLLVAYLSARAHADSGPLLLFLGVGLLGGFTTFSTFSVDTLALLNDDRVALAAVNVVANVGTGLVGALLGWTLGRHCFGG